MDSMIEALLEVIDSIKAETMRACPPQAAREFALAITSIEDAQFRIVRGHLLKQGRYALPEDAAQTLPAHDEPHLVHDYPMEGQLNLVDAIDAIDVDSDIPPAA